MSYLGMGKSLNACNNGMAALTAATIAAIIVHRADVREAKADCRAISADALDAAAESSAACAIFSIASAERFAWTAASTADLAISGSGDEYWGMAFLLKERNIT